MAGNSSFDAIISTTLKHYTPKLEDNIFGNSTLLYWLREAGNIEKVGGGEQLVEPILYASNTTVGAYQAYDSLSTTPQEGITSAVYDWKQYAGTVAISGIEEAKNNSREAVIALLKAKVDQLELSITDGLNTMLFDNPTTNTRNWNGIAAIVSHTETTSTKGDSEYVAGSSNTFVGNIDSEAAGNSWWQNQVNGTTQALSIPTMSNMFNRCSAGTVRPEFIITGQALWEKYESLLQPSQRFQDPKAASAGFENLMYKSAPVLWDEHIGGATPVTDRMYFLNSKFLKLKVHSDVWFKPTPFEKPHGQDAKYSQILCYGNLVTNNRRFLGVLTNKS